MIAWTLAALCLGTTPTLTLRGQAETAESIVRLADLVEPPSSPAAAALLRELQTLDVADLAEREPTYVSQRLVRLRLKLAGYTERDVRVQGAPMCAVERIEAQPVEERLGDRLRDEYARVWGLPPEDITVRLTGLVQLPDNDPLSTVRATLGATPRAGVQRAMLELVSRKGKRRVQPASHVVLVRRLVPLASRELKKGQLLDEDSIIWESQLESDPVEPLKPEQLVGRVVVRDLVSGEVIRPHHVRSAGEVQMVRSQGRVQCIARKGALSVSLPGIVALENGSYGDTIRLQNPVTKQGFTGTVDGPGLVRIELPASTPPAIARTRYPLGPTPSAIKR